MSYEKIKAKLSDIKIILKQTNSIIIILQNALTNEDVDIEPQALIDNLDIIITNIEDVYVIFNKIGDYLVENNTFETFNYLVPEICSYFKILRCSLKYEKTDFEYNDVYNFIKLVYDLLFNIIKNLKNLKLMPSLKGN